ncbi:hypothetical protein 1 [Hubei picorna-like virus 1]|uniref:hypothetical protein 1 n=1 Tax=Hubei picorna-like virus 1 TaxID=1923088 RepID=UPI00090A4731|nr:hypothetical protein 1 [Hubei picorna-like virus 1]APG78435.1 hypothetical protein 1 [Hubei picorna-like virus 1]
MNSSNSSRRSQTPLYVEARDPVVITSRMHKVRPLVYKTIAVVNRIFDTKRNMYKNWVTVETAGISGVYVVRNMEAMSPTSRDAYIVDIGGLDIHTSNSSPLAQRPKRRKQRAKPSKYPDLPDMNTIDFHCTAAGYYDYLSASSDGETDEESIQTPKPTVGWGTPPTSPTGWYSEDEIVGPQSGLEQIETQCRSTECVMFSHRMQAILISLAIGGNRASDLQTLDNLIAQIETRAHLVSVYSGLQHCMRDRTHNAFVCECDACRNCLIVHNLVHYLLAPRAQWILRTTPQSGMEILDDEPPSLSRLDATLMADDALRSPQDSSERSYGFSSASESSEDNSVRDMLTNVLSDMKDACQGLLEGASKSEKHIFSKIESVLWFAFYDWPRCVKTSDHILCITRLISAIVGIEGLASAASWIVDMFKSCITPQDGQESFTFDVKWLADAVKDVKSGELFRKITKCLCALMALAVSTGMGSSLTGSRFDSIWKMAKVVIKQSDLVGTVLNFLTWLLKSGHALFTGKLTLHDFFTKPSETQLFDMRVAKLDYYRAELEAGRYEEVTMTAFGLEVHTLMTFANQLQRVANKQLRLTLANQQRKIHSHWTWFKTAEASQPIRRAPYGVLLYGGTSVAKSCMMSIMTRMLQEAMGISVGPEYVYNYNPAEAYMTGFDHQKNTIELDDAGNTEVQFADKQVSSVLIDLINNNKRIAVMADLESKGQYLIKPDIVLVTTNVEQLHAGQTSVNSVATLRRLNWHLTIRIKKEFATPGGAMRDDVDPFAERLDVWDIDMCQWATKEGTEKDPVKINIKNNMSFAEVMEFLTVDAARYKAAQTLAVSNTTALKQTPLCPHKLIYYMCKKCHAEDPRVLPPQPVVVEPQMGFEYMRTFGFAMMNRGTIHPYRLLRAFWVVKIYNFLLSTERCVRMACAVQLTRADMAARASLHTIIFSGLQVAWLAIWLSLQALFVKALIVSIICNLCAYLLLLTGIASWYYRQPLAQNVTAAVKSVVPECNAKNAKKFVGLLAVVGVMYGVYKVWRRTNVKPQGGFASKIEGVSNHKELYNTLIMKPMPVNFDVKTASADQIATCMQPRLYIGRFLQSKDPLEASNNCVVVPICSETALVPWHILRDNKYKYVQIHRYSYGANNGHRLFSIEGCWKRIPNTDFCILSSPVFGDQKDIRSWFPKGSILGEDRERICVRNVGCQLIWAKGERTRNHTTLEFEVTKGVGKVNANSMIVSDMEKTHNLVYWGGKYTSCMPTWDGMCGSLLVTDRQSGPMIIGLHSAGGVGTTAARFCTIGLDDINNTMESMKSEIVPNSIMHESSDHKVHLDFKDTVFRYTEKRPIKDTASYVRGEYDILGYNTAPQRTFRSNVMVTIWSSELTAMGIPRMHEAPQIMNTFIPWNVWLTNVSAPSMIEAPYLLRARDEYAKHIVDELDKHPEWNLSEKIRPLSHDVVLAGLDGVKGIDAINRSTSMGIPYCKSKSEYIKPVDKRVEGISHPVDIPEFLKKEIREMENQLKMGQRVYVAHRCNLKDEAVKLNKLKVRVFMGSPFSYLYLMRKYFLPISAFMQEHPLMFETAVGINCYNNQWSELYKFLTRHGTKTMVAGDYKAYDQKMEIALTKAAFEILLMICAYAGYDEEQMTICRGLMTETIAGCYDLKGEWIGLTSANPSGHALTVIINSIANSIQVRAAFYKLTPDQTLQFAKYVALCTYGDDNIMGVSEKVPWFNHTSIAAVMKEWGITYTMAEKEALSVPYINISECSFLKRRWVWCERRKRFMAPLEEASIFKTLHTYVASKAIGIGEHHAHLLISANREYFMHGDDVFREKHAVLTALAVEYDLTHHFAGMRLPDLEALDAWVANM